MQSPCRNFSSSSLLAKDNTEISHPTTQGPRIQPLFNFYLMFCYSLAVLASPLTIYILPQWSCSLSGKDSLFPILQCPLPLPSCLKTCLSLYPSYCSSFLLESFFGFAFSSYTPQYPLPISLVILIAFKHQSYLFTCIKSSVTIYTSLYLLCIVYSWATIYK